MSAREHEGDVVFLHRLTPGAVSKSYGIAVARLAGLPESVLGRASAILAALESDTPLSGGPGAVRREPQHPQLDLFHKPKEPSAADAVALELRHIDPNRLTPLEALELLARLKRRLD